MHVNEKIGVLRDHMSQHGIGAYIMPSSDSHQSEYVADYWKIREWISGFSGSAGTAVVTQDFAGLWTDGRYFLQAEMQLADNEFVLCKSKQHGQPSFLSWLSENLSDGQKVGFDGCVVSLEQYRIFEKNLSEHGLRVEHAVDLITPIWQNRPDLPTTSIYEHELRLTGMSREEKLSKVRGHLINIGADHQLVCALDNIAYVLNIRANDVESNPVSISYLLIGQKEGHFFVDDQKLNSDLLQKLADAGLIIHPYEDLRSHLSQIPSAESICFDPSTTSIQIYHSISTDKIVEERSCIMKHKAIKTDIEIGHIRQAMIKDGVALTKTYKWLEETLAERSVSEVELSEKIAFHRSLMDGYRQESFDAIVGYKGNGAIIHYKPAADTCAYIEADGILLVDSGGQYEDGTTDTTRTLALGQPGDEEKKAYTLVLKGLISLSEAIFPNNTTGVQLDILARQHLWQHHMNYNHGTGHGVGYFLNVHEPPQGFTPGLSERGTTAMEAGMLTSNEPGYYKEGFFGIRLENLVVTQKEEIEGFLSHETLTLYPFETYLLDMSILSSHEVDWINGYHQKVLEKLTPSLLDEEKDWLAKKCQPI